jgi:hypothetical protein
MGEKMTLKQALIQAHADGLGRVIPGADGLLDVGTVLNEEQANVGATVIVEDHGGERQLYRIDPLSGDKLPGAPYLRFRKRHPIR